MSTISVATTAATRTKSSRIHRGGARRSPTSTTSEQSAEQTEIVVEDYCSSQPAANDVGVYWNYDDSPKATEELRRKLQAIDDASPTVKNRQRNRNQQQQQRKQTPKLRMRLRKREKNLKEDEEAKEMLRTMNELCERIVKTGAAKSADDDDEDEEKDLFEDDGDDSLLLMASHQIEDEKKNDNDIQLFDDSFDAVLSQIPDETLRTTPSKPPQTKLPRRSRLFFDDTPTKVNNKNAFKRHGSSDDAVLSSSSNSNSSWKRNNSEPSENPSSQNSLPGGRCSQDEIERKRLEALKKRVRKQEIEIKRQEALRRRNLSQSIHNRRK